MTKVEKHRAGFEPLVISELGEGREKFTLAGDGFPLIAPLPS